MVVQPKPDWATPSVFLYGATPLACPGVAVFHVGQDPLYVRYVRHSGQHPFTWSFQCPSFADMLQRTGENSDVKRMPACKQVASPILFKMLLFSKSWANDVENSDIACNLDAKTRESASAELCVYGSAWTYRNRCVGVYTVKEG